MALSGEQYPIRAGEHEAIIVEVGAGLRGYTVGGIDVTAAYGEHELAPRGCGATLVPWPNRLRGGHYAFDGHEYQVAITELDKVNSLHGLARWARWNAVSHADSSVTLGIDIVPQTGWPFEVRVEVTYSVDAERGLRVEVSATNNGATPAPFGVGFHPYLSTRGHALDDCVLTVPARTHLRVDQAQIPVGTEPVEGTPFDLRAGRALGSARLDDAFTDLDEFDGRHQVTVSTPSGGARLWMGPAFGYTQVFTNDDLAHGEPAIAVEPMSCPADAFNSGDGLVVLGPAGQWRGEWGIEPLPG
jgi:aldose 1-epimerase